MYSLFSICAESVVTDAINNRISIFNVIDEVNVQQFPALFTKLTALFALIREDGDPEEIDTVFVCTQAGTELGRSPISGNFDGRPRLRIVTVVQGIVIPGPGLFRAALLLGEQELGHWEFTITQVPPPEQPAAELLPEAPHPIAEPPALP